MNAKTPVTILQEFMVKRSLIPVYEFLPDSEGVGTHMPLFKCLVSAGNVTAVGKGRTKKEAKHEAAQLALEKFSIEVPTNLKALPSSSPDHTVPPVVNSLEINAIGLLKDLCAEKRIPAPDFRLLSDVGPAHLRHFTMECTVGSMTATSTDLTKKKAKQNCANKVLQRLLNSLPEEIAEMELVAPDCNEVINKYNELSAYKNQNVNWGTKIADYPKTIKLVMEENKITYEELWKDEPALEEVMERLEIHYNIDVEVLVDYLLVFVQTDTSPTFSFAVKCKNKEEGQKAALQELFDFIRLLSK